ncbi:MAG: hypothetical protein KJO79_10410 [Verrucomicrobiae bacterium]|nr:hypothetical protein [Verrucomicrobiae bacterium]NNJ87583.1 hypothetical protein [Akkermansiaceae bacterium]
MKYHRKTLQATISCLAIGMILPAGAQVYNPGSGGGNNTPQNNNNNGNTTIVRQKKENKSPYGNEVPFIDPTQETITLMGHTFNLGDKRLGGQFESYLADTPNTSKAAQEYRETIDAILTAVSPHTKGISIPQKLRNGFALLPRAASYPGDGRICDSLSNAIYAAMLSKGAVSNSKDYIANLEKEKKRIIYNADIVAKKKDLIDGEDTKTRPGQGSRGKKSTLEKSTQSFELQEMQKRILEIEALKKLHQAKDEVNIIQAKIQYQALLAQLFVQRRFEHVVIGTRFYNLIFRDGDSRMRLKKGSDVSKFFGEGLGVDPTVTGLDSAANEAMRKVTTFIAAFKNHLAHNELHSASKRLTEAFAIGEFLPAVQTVPGDQRRKILEYVRDGNALVKAMDVRDYAQAKILLEDLKKQSSDFDSTKAQGAIAAYTRVSDGHIRSAQIALMKGDEAKFEQELKNATQVWPTNPRLREIDKRLDNLMADGDVAKKLLDDFDRLLSEQNYREIFKRQYEFVPVVKDDPTRKDAVEQIVRNIQRIDISLLQAREFSKLGNDYAAWESLATLRDEFPKDPELLRELEKLSSKVADFTVALTRAKEYENNTLNPQTGSALTWYLEAKSIYPDSKHAQKGIDRLTKRVLPSITDLPSDAPASSSTLDDDVSLD